MKLGAADIAYDAGGTIHPSAHVEQAQWLRPTIESFTARREPPNEPDFRLAGPRAMLYRILFARASCKMPDSLLIKFKLGMGEDREFELEQKEWCDDVLVVSQNRTYELAFISLLRLSQEQEEYTRKGIPYVIERSTVVLEKINVYNIHEAIDRMKLNGFFRD